MASNNLTICQIGDIPVRFFQQAWHGYTSSARTETETFLYSREIAFSNSARLIEEHNVTMSGVVVAWNNASVPDQLQQLQSVLGVETDIIAYELISCCSAGCCACENGYQDILFFSTRGVLERVSASENNQVDQVQVSLTLDTTWKPLNRSVWEWSSSKPSVWLPQPAPSNPDIVDILRPYPFVMDFEASPCSGNHFQKRYFDDPLLQYRTELWPFLHSRHRPMYPSTGLGRSHSSSAPTTVVQCNRDIFSAEPSSLYSFSNFSLSPTGVITIAVQRHYGNQLWQTTTQLTTIDLAQVDAELAAAGFGGLDPQDQLVTGNIPRRYMPALIIRAGAILNTFVTVNYAGEYPGATGLERSRVDVTKPPNVFYGYLHTFRRL